MGTRQKPSKFPTQLFRYATYLVPQQPTTKATILWAPQALPKQSRLHKQQHLPTQDLAFQTHAAQYDVAGWRWLKGHNSICLTGVAQEMACPAHDSLRLETFLCSLLNNFWSFSSL